MNPGTSQADLAAVTATLRVKAQVISATNPAPTTTNNLPLTGRLSASLLATVTSAAMEEFVPVAARLRAAKMTWRLSIAIALRKVAIRAHVLRTKKEFKRTRISSTNMTTCVLMTTAATTTAVELIVLQHQ